MGIVKVEMALFHLIITIKMEILLINQGLGLGQETIVWYKLRV